MTSLLSFRTAVLLGLLLLPALSLRADGNAPAPDPAPTAPVNPPEPPMALDPRLAVTKVHEVRNDESNHPRHNEALQFELDYWNYGAITAEQREERRGQIYVISWKNSGPPYRFVARFEYRQAKTREQIKVQTLDHPAVSGNARSIFKVTGAEFRTDGPVETWRFTVLRNNKVVAEEKSFIW
jgi:hypothetical protein